MGTLDRMRAWDAVHKVEMQRGEAACFMEAQRGHRWSFDFWMFVRTVATEYWGIYGSAFMISVTKYINLDSARLRYGYS